MKKAREKEETHLHCCSRRLSTLKNTTFLSDKKSLRKFWMIRYFNEWEEPMLLTMSNKINRNSHWDSVNERHLLHYHLPPMAGHPLDLAWNWLRMLHWFFCHSLYESLHLCNALIRRSLSLKPSTFCTVFLLPYKFQK